MLTKEQTKTIVRRPAYRLYNEAILALKNAVILNMHLHFVKKRLVKIIIPEGTFIPYLKDGQVRIILDQSATIRCYDGTLTQFIERFEEKL